MIVNRYLKELLRTEKHELAAVWWAKEDAEQMYDVEFTDTEWDEIADMFNYNIDHCYLSEILYDCMTEILNDRDKEVGNKSTR